MELKQPGQGGSALAVPQVTGLPGPNEPSLGKVVCCETCCGATLCLPWAEWDSGTVFLELAPWTPGSAPKIPQGQSCLFHQPGL